MPKITKLQLHLLKIFRENYWLLFFRTRCTFSCVTFNTILYNLQIYKTSEETSELTANQLTMQKHSHKQSSYGACAKRSRCDLPAWWREGSKCHDNVTNSINWWQVQNCSAEQSTTATTSLTYTDKIKDNLPTHKHSLLTIKYSFSIVL